MLAVDERAGLVELRRRAIGFDDCNVGTRGTGHRHRHDVDGFLGEQRDQVISLGARAGDDGAGLDAVCCQSARHVDALAAGIDLDAERADDGTPVE